jgi:alpha-tubulin suppressor-like RCC1 family protein
MLNDKKEAFICPWEGQRKNINYIALKLFFPNKDKITMISCGDNFSVFLSQNGNIYSMGSNNKYGQLGHGDTDIQLSPKVIKFFKYKKIKICQISCGYSHTLAIWIRVIPYFLGLGGEGQIGQGFEIEVKLFRLLIIL